MGRLSELDISGLTTMMWLCWIVLVIVCVRCPARQTVKETSPGRSDNGHVTDNNPRGDSDEGSYHPRKNLAESSQHVFVDALNKDLDFDDEYLEQSPDSFFGDSPMPLEEEEEDFLFLEKPSDPDPFLRDSPTQEQFLYGPNNSRTSRFNFTWPLRDLVSAIDGDITLGALHMVHERSEGMVCGKIMPQGGIQALETMLYTMDYVNGEGRWAGRGVRVMPPGVRLGVLAKDDCDRDIFGLEQAVEFIKGKWKS